MIFRIKHSWRIAMAVTVVWTAANWLLDGWREPTGGRFDVPTQIAIGVAGALLAIAVNAFLHGTCTVALGPRYTAAFLRHARDVVDGMRWPEFVAAGLMAALAEEPFFRGLILRSFDAPLPGVAVAAVLFAACHWFRRNYLGFWFWALWEGVLFGLLMVATGSLIVPVIAHGLHDLVGYRVFRSLVDRSPESNAHENRAES